MGSAERREMWKKCAERGESRRSPNSYPPLRVRERAVAEPNFWRVLYCEGRRVVPPGQLCVCESARDGRVTPRSFVRDDATTRPMH